MPRSTFLPCGGTTPRSATVRRGGGAGPAADVRSQTRAGIGNPAHADGTSVRHVAAEEEAQPWADGAGKSGSPVGGEGRDWVDVRGTERSHEESKSADDGFGDLNFSRTGRNSLTPTGGGQMEATLPSGNEYRSGKVPDDFLRYCT